MPKLPRQVKNVLAKTVLVRRRVTWFENAGVNAAAQMFNERAEKTTIEFRYCKIRVENDPSFIHWGN